MATAEQTFSPEEVRKFVSYEPSSGVLTWRPRSFGTYFGNLPLTDKGVRYFNTLYAGKRAGSPRSGGYLGIRIMGRVFLSHRVCWALHYGEWPALQVDHINGVKTDNRLCNLRVVDAGGNSRNFSRFSSNTSGHTGVHWDRVNRKWLASIFGDGKKRNLGRYENFDDAVAARKVAERVYGFHENHGRDPHGYKT